jgi:hypothetical protein
MQISKNTVYKMAWKYALLLQKDANLICLKGEDRARIRDRNLTKSMGSALE